MGVFTYESEFTSVIPPARLFKAFILDADNLIPKIAPQAVKSTEILQGDGGVGTIKKINLGEGSEYSYVKHQIDGIDKDNFVYKYSMIEGDAISDKIEKISYETKLVASSDGGSVIKSTSCYHTKGDVEIKEEHVKAGKERAAGLFKIIESHLVANPDAYN
ncbi:major strawberry allergen Fra a 1.08-like [Argentina anserina]|uniref:major strawberry allergen Fra a 1.08-like n=1 Tax=Argentina anserina TaxID=57926 RepID=UPI0021765418|nr:major strawberry allergen Fra a 1.08-like [Potentilla anserina]XP_050378745.1 major strawberry allergen Fra a 1.08-like [Potentilla anserina]XP_050378746.1 major strawberry allergen Fra a 1.08-like [Potentilla anserina]